MIPLAVDYASPSALQLDRARQTIGLQANRRRPVQFHGRVLRHRYELRLALQALGAVIWADESWESDRNAPFVLDPVVTVHPDRVFFEAFSQDQSAYAAVVLPRGMFEPTGDVTTGTTNIDFTGWLWASLGEIRSSRETWLDVESSGVGVETVGAGGRFEGRVELPDDWVRGFLHLQSVMASPGTSLQLRPVELLAVIRFLRAAKSSGSPRALRYELLADGAQQIVLEPWEQVIPLRANGAPRDRTRAVRTWGRRRLRLLEPLLPYADAVEVYLKGRARPSFYAVSLGDIVFLLGLSGWTSQSWHEMAGVDLLQLGASPAAELLDRAAELLGASFASDAQQLAEQLGVPLATAAQLAEALCRQGVATYDIQRGEFRHRPLFEAPVDERWVFPEELRVTRARALVAAGQVRVATCERRESRSPTKPAVAGGGALREVVHHDWRVTGAADGLDGCEVILDDCGRVIFGHCQCEFFAEQLLNLGPCEHQLALLLATQETRAEEGA